MLLLLGCSDTSTNPDNPIVPRLYFSPRTTNIQAGEEAVLQLCGENLPTTVFAVSMQIEYSESILAFVDSTGIEGGDLFGEEALYFGRSEASILHLTATLLQGDNFATESGTLMRIILTGAAQGSCTLNIISEELHFYNENGEAITISDLEISTATVRIQ